MDKDKVEVKTFSRVLSQFKLYVQDSSIVFIMDQSLTNKLVKSKPK